MERVGRTIPLNLTIEILSWLPARSLLRFRRVCKLWLSITSDPRFIDTNLDCSRKSRPPSVLLFLPSYDGDHCGITVMDDDTKRTPDRLLIVPRSPDHPRGKLLMSHPCNGLVCISDGDGFIQLLNPTTGERHTPPPHYSRANSRFLALPCLGFHPETKEYKVVRFYMDLDFDDDEKYGLGCEVYTLGTNSWRQIQCTHNCFPIESAVNANGALYWRINIDYYNTRDGVLLSFELKEERFTWISPLDFTRFYPKKTYFVRSVVELQGSVCLPVCKDGLNGMDIWMMALSSDGTKHEWALKYSFSCLIFTFLFIHNERILVRDDHDYDLSILSKDEPPVLVYHHLECKDGCTREVYRKGRSESPLIYHHLECNDGSNYEEYYEDLYRNIGIWCAIPFAHVESLVSLREQ